jgi:hypothetical protein
LNRGNRITLIPGFHDCLTDRIVTQMMPIIGANSGQRMRDLITTSEDTISDVWPTVNLARRAD